MNTKILITLFACVFSLFAQKMTQYHQNVNRMQIDWLNNGTTEDGHGYNAGVGFMYSAGFGVSALVNGEVRNAWISSADRIDEFRAGPVGGTDPTSGIFVVNAADTLFDPAVEPVPQSLIDWAEAIELGAEWVDKNNDGVYDPANGDRPNILASETFFMVVNDDVLQADRPTDTPPMQVEVRLTGFAFSRADALGDIVYIRFTFVNKSSNNFDDLYFSIIHDADLGVDYQDDAIGCDTVFAHGSGVVDNFGFIWNGNTSGSTDGSAFGVDFFQGPVVDAVSVTDTAFIRRGPLLGVDTIPGKRNAAMASFYTYPNGDSPVSANPAYLGVRRAAEGGLDHNDGSAIDPTALGVGGLASDNPKYLYSGDPVTATGWWMNTEQDRRYMLTTEAFDLAAGEAQDVVVGWVYGSGSDNHDAIQNMRTNDLLAQIIFDGNFIAATPPPPPILMPRAKDDGSLEVIIDLETNGTSSYNFKDAEKHIYLFGGVEIYQFNNDEYQETLADGRAGYKVVARYDVVDGHPYIYTTNPQTGEFSQVWEGGISIDQNQKRVVVNIPTNVFDGTKFVRGQTYHLGARAFSYNTTIASDLNGFKYSRNVNFNPIAIAAKSYRYGVDFLGEVISLDFEQSGSQDRAETFITRVAEPSELTGHDYSITFFEDTLDGDALKYRINDVTAGTIVLDSMDNYVSDINAYSSWDTPIVDGFQVAVKAIPTGLDASNSTGNVYSNAAFNYATYASYTNIEYQKLYKDYEMRVVAGPADTSTTLVTVVIDDAGTPDTLYHGYPFINPETGTPLFAYTTDFLSSNGANTDRRWLQTVQWEMWELGDDNDDPSDDTQIWLSTVYGYFTFGTGHTLWGLLDHVNFPESVYDPNNIAGFYTTAAANGRSRLAGTYSAFSTAVHGRYDWMSRIDVASEITKGATYRWTVYNPFTSGSSITFNTESKVNSFTKSDQKAELANMKVVPNPFLGTHGGMESINKPYVTFTHVPPGKATFNIFTVDGQHVRTLEKNDDLNYMDWDLRTKANLIVASGMYIVHVDVEGVGTKVVKLYALTNQPIVQTR